MRIGDLAPGEVRAQLRGAGVRVGMGPFAVLVRSDIPDVATHLVQMYTHHRHLPTAEFADFHVQVRRQGGIRRWVRGQAIFLLDGETPFRPLPIEQAFPMLEWGLNWCISNLAHQYLIVHAAVVERDGRAAIMPGEPGAGKSTLCAALVSRGWRLLSDELALFCTSTKRLVPLARPVNLKNESISLIRGLAPETVLTRAFTDTTKGTVALMRPPEASVRRGMDAAAPGWIIAPRYEPGAGCRVVEQTKGRTLMSLADLSFNYSLLGVTAFDFLADLVESVPSLRLTYDDLDRAIDRFEALAGSVAA